MTKGEAVKALNLENKGEVDYALPQEWLDHVVKVTGIYAAHCFVWLYDEQAKIFGRPYPLTVEGINLLKKYNKRTGSNYPIPEVLDVFA